MPFRQDGRADKALGRAFPNQRTKQKSRYDKPAEKGITRRGSSGRRAMRNMIRFKERQAGRYWDGRPFTGSHPERFFPDKVFHPHPRVDRPEPKNGAVPQMPRADRNGQSSGITPSMGLSASDEFCRNSEAILRDDSPVESPVHQTCPHCGVVKDTDRTYARCSSCHKKYSTVSTLTDVAVTCLQELKSVIL